MRCRFKPADPDEDLASENGIPASIRTVEEEADTEDIHPEEAAGDLTLIPIAPKTSEGSEFEPSDIDSAKTEFAVPKQTSSAFMIMLILVALILGSGLAAMQFPQVKEWVRQNLPASLQKFVPPNS
jgi:hypothetical protein